MVVIILKRKTMPRTLSMDDQAERLKSYMDSLKSRKEEFVTGLTGSTISEINQVTAIALTVYVASLILKLSNKNGKTAQKRPIRNSILDFCLNWLVLLLAVTLYANKIQLLHSLVLVPVALFPFLSSQYNFFQRTTKQKSKKRTGKKLEAPELKLVKKSFITSYRSHMLILTAISILAVDFEIFPRRFGKVETWGTSLMDIGVGSFVFSNGAVSARAIIKETLQSHSKTSYSKKFILSFKHGLILLTIGLLRLYFVKNLEYQEHVTEYGVHWNFFMTLSLLPPFLVLVVEPITMATRMPRFVIAVAISLITEYCLIYKDGMIGYLITGDRDTFINANREGLWSFFGYCSIFLWGQTIGMFCLTNVPYVNNLFTVNTDLKCNKPTSSFDKLTTVTPIKGMLIWLLLLGPCVLVINKCDPFACSRRFANLPYVGWVVTYNIGAILCYATIDHFYNYLNGYKQDDETSLVTIESLEAINSNGLALFLLANVSTGLTNMLTNTLDASSTAAFVTLSVYCMFLYLVSIILYRCKVCIKF